MLGSDVVLGSSGFVSHLALIPQEVYRSAEHCIVCVHLCV